MRPRSAGAGSGLPAFPAPRGPQGSPGSRASRRAVARSNAASLSPVAWCQPARATLGLRPGWADGGERVPAGAGFGEEAEAGPFGELGEHIAGRDAEPL